MHFVFNICNTVLITICSCLEWCTFSPYMINNANVATSANARENEVEGRERARERRNREGRMREQELA